MPETCACCHEDGEDRRTLWMACFYEMKELRTSQGQPIPFEERFLYHTDAEKLKLSAPAQGINVGGQTINLKAGNVKTSEDLTPMGLYTLRVCKDCRARWMEAIRVWFSAGKPQETAVNSGIYIRRNGATVEISQEEWDRDWADKIKPPSE